MIKQTPAKSALKRKSLLGLFGISIYSIVCGRCGFYFKDMLLGNKTQAKCPICATVNTWGSIDNT